MDAMALAAQRAVARALETLGAPGVTGLGILAFCAAFYVGTLKPGIAGLESLEQQKSKLESARSAQRAAGAMTPEQQLASFYSGLPKSSEIETVAQSVFALGKSFGVTLRQGSYRYVKEDGAKLGRYEITYLAQTEYYRIRLMLREMQRSMPALALEDIAFQRQQAAVPAPEVTLKFSLYVRQG